MSALRGMALGVLGLSLGYAVVSSSSASANTGAVFTTTAAAIRRLVDPTVPLIPDKR